MSFQGNMNISFLSPLGGEEKTQTIHDNPCGGGNIG